MIFETFKSSDVYIASQVLLSLSIIFDCSADVSNPFVFIYFLLVSPETTINDDITQDLYDKSWKAPQEFNDLTTRSFFPLEICQQIYSGICICNIHIEIKGSFSFSHSRGRLILICSISAVNIALVLMSECKSLNLSTESEIVFDTFCKLCFTLLVL